MNKTQRYSSKKGPLPHAITSLDISQYSDSGSYIVAELESEPLRRDLSQFMNVSEDNYSHGTTKSNNSKDCKTPHMVSSSSNISSNTVPNGFLSNGSPTTSTNEFLKKEVYNWFLIIADDYQ